MRATVGTSGMAMAMMVFSRRAERRRHHQGHDQQRQRLHDVHQERWWQIDQPPR